MLPVLPMCNWILVNFTTSRMRTMTVFGQVVCACNALVHLYLLLLLYSHWCSWNSTGWFTCRCCLDILSGCSNTQLQLWFSGNHLYFGVFGIQHPISQEKVRINTRCTFADSVQKKNMQLCVYFLVHALHNKCMIIVITHKSSISYLVTL